MEETASNVFKTRVPRYDYNKRPRVWLSAVLLLPTVVGIILRQIEPFYTLGGLLLGCALFFQFGRTAPRMWPGIPWWLLSYPIIAYIILPKMPRDQDSWTNASWEFQYFGLAGFAFLWLTYILRKILAKRAAANESTKVI